MVDWAESSFEGQKVQHSFLLKTRLCFGCDILANLTRITDMNGFRYAQCARMIIDMPTSTNYVELVGLLFNSR